MKKNNIKVAKTCITNACHDGMSLLMNSSTPGMISLSPPKNNILNYSATKNKARRAITKP